MLLVIGVISLLGALGAPDLAGAAQGHAATTQATSVKASHVVAKGALRTSAFNAGRVKFAARSTEARSTGARPDVKPASPPTLYVNASTGVDMGSCRLSTHPCLTIDYAITRAPSPATIDVAAGTYAEQVVDSTSLNLNIVGAGAANTTIEPSSLPVSDTDTDSSQPQYAIVDAQPGSTVDLSGMTIDGNAAMNTFNSCSNNFVGVYYHDANGTMSNVTVQNIVLPPDDFGCQDGLAIYAAADTSMTTNVTMSAVTVTNYDKNGITCDDTGTTCSVTGSTVTGIGCTGLIGQNGIQGYGADTVTLSTDTVTENCYSGSGYVATGLLLYDNSASSATSVTADTDDVGIYAGNDGSGPATTRITISHCTASNASYANMLGGVGVAIDSGTAGSVENSKMNSDQGEGLALYSTSHFTIKSNKANSDYDGFYIGQYGSVAGNSSHNAVSLNKVSNETDDGMYVDSGTSVNTFTSNKAKNDINYAYQDFSTGSRTAGTANTWTTDHCTPSGDSTPSGLC